jgi:hypothetical protein
MMISKKSKLFARLLFLSPWVLQQLAWVSTPQDCFAQAGVANAANGR